MSEAPIPRPHLVIHARPGHDRGAARAEFGRQVQDALLHLHDLAYLQTHALARVIRPPASEPPVGAGTYLRGRLLEAIESLRPDTRLAAGARASRRYQILTLRYAEGLDPSAVQARLGIGKSAYYADHRQALDGVVSLLREQWDIAGRVGSLGAPAPLADRQEARQGDAGGGMSAESSVYRRAFVGRETELARLSAALAGAIAGQGALVMVVGEPGIGKTSLCEQLAVQATRQGSRVLVGHCYEEGSLSLPYLPFVEALGSYVLARPDAALDDEPDADVAEVARIVPPLRERVRVERRPVRDPEEERWRLLEAVCGFLRKAATVQPVLLVLEDLHWADSGTLDLLLHVARSLRETRMLLVGTYRDVDVDRAHPLSAVLAELRRLGELPRLQLRGLNPMDIQRMMHAITGEEGRSGFAEAVHRQTEGNPLFVQEVIRYLAEEGLIWREGGRWHRAGAASPEMSVPDGLRDVIGKRLSRLTPECNRVLTVAAVIGREFDLATLQTVLAPVDDVLTDALEEAVHVGILQEQARPGAIRFRFAHAFFRQTLYEELFALRRVRLHRDVARALEKQYAAHPEEHAAEMAEHFAQSTDPVDLGKAIHYGELAARRAMAVGAHGEAARHYERMLRIQEAVDPDDRAKLCDLLLAFGEALSLAGEPQRAIDEVAPRALALAESLGDAKRAFQACREAGEGYIRYGAGARLLDPAYRQWAVHADRYAAPGTIERAFADIWLAHVAPDEDERWRRSLEALAAARRWDDARLFIEAAHRATAGSPGSAEQFQEMLRVVREVVAAPRDLTYAGAVHLHMFAGAMLLAVGERAGAEALWNTIRMQAPRLHDPVALLALLQIDAEEAMLDGRLDDAVAIGAQLLARAEEVGSPVMARSFAHAASHRPLLLLGRGAEALEDARTELNTPGREGKAGVCLAWLGRANDARQCLYRVLTPLRPGPDHAERGARSALLADLLETAILIGESNAAQYLAGRLEGLVATKNGQIDLFNVALLIGQAKALEGDRAAALESYGRSLEWATSIRYRPEIALTRLHMAELLLADALTPEGELTQPPRSQRATEEQRRKALGHLAFAIAEFRAMKMQPVLERALGLMRLVHA